VISIANNLGNTEGKSIIDVGAANGVISKIFSNQFSKSVIYSFEPVKETFSELQQSVAGYPHINIINKALGSKPGSQEINITNRITSSSLLEVSNSINDPYFKESLKHNRKETIVISTLDSEIPLSEKILILKMDVQGFELEVLKGGAATLKRTDIILLELQNHEFYNRAPQYYDIDQFLRQSEFELYDVIPSIRKAEKLLEWDAIYISKNFVSGGKKVQGK
jgi:FkbM family methyltransferase